MDSWIWDFQTEGIVSKSTKKYRYFPKTQGITIYRSKVMHWISDRNFIEQQTIDSYNVGTEELTRDFRP